MHELTLDNALQILREIEHGIDENALWFALDHWEEFLPFLLREIEQAEIVCREDESYEISIFHVAVILCAVKHEARAFPALCRRVEEVGDELVPYGFSAYRLPAALAACCDDAEALMSMFENKRLSDTARECAFHALVHLSRSGHWDKEAFEAWFADLLRTRVNEFSANLGSSLVVSGIGLLPEVVREISRSYIEKHKGDDMVVERLLHALDPKNAGVYGMLSEVRYRPVESAADELDLLLDANSFGDGYSEIVSLASDPDYLLGILSDDEEKELLELESVGRNDRCPCGSGKKFKKCCEGKTFVQATANRVSHLGTLVRQEDQFISDLMEAGYKHAEMGDRPAQLASWLLCIAELQARIPKSVNDPEAVERKKLFVGHNPLDEWLDDFCLLVYEMFLDKDTMFMTAQPHIEWIASHFTGAAPLLRNHFLMARSLVRYLDESVSAAVADLRKAIGIYPEESGSRCLFAEFAARLGAEGAGEAKKVLREGIALKKHPSMEAMLASIEMDFPDVN